MAESFLAPLDLSGPRDTCGPDCDRFVAKWHAWWDGAFSDRNRPAMLETPATHDAYLQLIGAKSRNMLVKARRAGVQCEQFDHDSSLDALHEINRSMPVRSGGPMRPAYMIRPPAIGPMPKLCAKHRHLWLGARISEGPELKLVAYCHLVIANELAIVNTILGHGDYLKHGIMNALVDRIAWEAILGRMTVRYTNYLTLHGPERLARFKRSVGFRETPIDRLRGYALCTEQSGCRADHHLTTCPEGGRRNAA